MGVVMRYPSRYRTTRRSFPDLTSSLSREILRAQVNKREIGKQDTPLDKTGRPLGYR
jgi:hypothetical protein